MISAGTLAWCADEREPDWAALPADHATANSQAAETVPRKKNLKRRLHDSADARIEIEEVPRGSGRPAVVPAKASDSLQECESFAWTLARGFFCSLLSSAFLSRWFYFREPVARESRHSPSSLLAPRKRPSVRSATQRFRRMDAGVALIAISDGKRKSVPPLGGSLIRGQRIVARHGWCGTFRSGRPTAGSSPSLRAGSSRRSMLLADRLRLFAMHLASRWRVESRRCHRFCPDAAAPCIAFHPRRGEHTVTTLDTSSGEFSHRLAQLFAGWASLPVFCAGREKQGINVGSLDTKDRRLLVNAASAGWLRISGYVLFSRNRA